MGRKTEVEVVGDWLCDGFIATLPSCSSAESVGVGFLESGQLRQSGTSGLLLESPRRRWNSMEITGRRGQGVKQERLLGCGQEALGRGKVCPGSKL